MIKNRIRKKIVQIVKNISKMRVRTSRATRREAGEHAGWSSGMQAGVEEHTLFGYSDGCTCIPLSTPDGGDVS